MRPSCVLVALVAGALSSNPVRAGERSVPAPRSTSAAERAALRDARIAQNRAIAAGDLDGVARFWTDDVTVRRALGQPLSGRAAARQALEPSATPGSRVVYQRNATAFDVSLHWPLAFETGKWEGHSGTVSGPTVIGGRYSAQWVKRDGRWLIRSEVFVALSCAGVGCESAAVP